MYDFFFFPVRSGRAVDFNACSIQGTRVRSSARVAALGVELRREAWPGAGRRAGMVYTWEGNFRAEPSHEEGESDGEASG